MFAATGTAGVRLLQVLADEDVLVPVVKVNILIFLRCPSALSVRKVVIGLRGPLTASLLGFRPARVTQACAHSHLLAGPCFIRLLSPLVMLCGTAGSRRHPRRSAVLPPQRRLRKVRLAAACVHFVASLMFLTVANRSQVVRFECACGQGRAQARHAVLHDAERCGCVVLLHSQSQQDL